jgi:SAM-dependent methyltransferase
MDRDDVADDDRDPRRRFSRTVEEYRRYRPSYPEALVDWIVAHLPARARVVDVGAGTGIFSRQLASRELEVIGVEPNADMRAVAERGGEARYVAGEAAALNLSSHSADLVVAAQAFHWFALAPTLAEWRRVARPDGWCGVVFNLRASTPFADAYQALLDGLVEYRVAPKAADALRALEVARPDSGRRPDQPRRGATGVASASGVAPWRARPRAYAPRHAPSARRAASSVGVGPVRRRRRRRGYRGRSVRRSRCRRCTGTSRRSSRSIPK